MEASRETSGLLFGPLEAEEAERLAGEAIREDLPAGDVTTESLIPEGVLLRGTMVAREAGVVCGGPVEAIFWRRLDPRASLRLLVPDGGEVRAGQGILEVKGPARSVLAGERIALNFLQRLSGIATRARRWSRRLEGTSAVLLDTRKTIPGWRRLEKYAVRAGGGANHRFSLSDQALVKDNHVKLLRGLGAGGPLDWVRSIRQRRPGVKVEVEVESLADFREAVAAGADIILLDNMPLAEMAAAAGEARARPGPRPLLEASGGITEERLREVAATGVDRISAGALTHSAPALDVAFDFVEVTRDGSG